VLNFARQIGRGDGDLAAAQASMAERHRQLLEALAGRGVRGVTVGRIVEASDGKIAVTLADQDASAAPLNEIEDMPAHPAELAEAAWCAIFMGGASVKLFFDQMMADMPGGGEPKRCCP